MHTHTVHVDSVSVSSCVLVRLDESRRQRLGYEVEADELAYAREHLTVVLGALVDAQHHRRHVAEYCRAHQRYTRVHMYTIVVINVRKKNKKTLINAFFMKKIKNVCKRDKKRYPIFTCF